MFFKAQPCRSDLWLQAVLHVQTGDGRGDSQGLLPGDCLPVKKPRY